MSAHSKLHYLTEDLIDRAVKAKLESLGVTEGSVVVIDPLGAVVKSWRGGPDGESYEWHNSALYAAQASYRTGLSSAELQDEPFQMHSWERSCADAVVFGNANTKLVVSYTGPLPQDKWADIATMIGVNIVDQVRQAHASHQTKS